MELFIVIRQSKPSDELKYNDIIHNGIMANMHSAFWASITREITFQLVVLTAAIMFIFFGFPFTYCILAFPTVLMGIYFIIYISYWMKSAECRQRPKPMTCLVAEAYEPYFFTQNRKNVKYSILNDDNTVDKRLEHLESGYQRTIIGVITLNNHRHRYYSAWISSLFVSPKYYRKGVATALVTKATNLCEIERLESIECVTTECQDEARQFFVSTGFQMIQMYHKKLGIASIEKYQMGIEISPPL